MKKRNLHHATHAAHAAHATHTAHTAHGALVVAWGIDNHGLGGAQKGSNTGSILKTGDNDLVGVENTAGIHVTVLAVRGIVTVVEVVVLDNLGDHNSTLTASVGNDGLGGDLDGGADNVDSELLVKVLALEGVEDLEGLEESGTTSGEDTLVNSALGSVQSIDDSRKQTFVNDWDLLDISFRCCEMTTRDDINSQVTHMTRKEIFRLPVLLLTDLDLTLTANTDDGNTRAETGQTLLELLALIVGGASIGDQGAELLAALSNGLGGAGASAVEDSVLLGNGDRANGSQKVGGEALELDIELIREDNTSGQSGEITQDGLAVVTETGSLDSSNGELAAELVEDGGSESLAINVLSNDEERAALGGSGLEGGENVLKNRDLLLGKEDQRLFEFDLLGLGVSDKVGRDVAAVEAHTLSDLELVLSGLAVLDGDDTLLTNLLHGLGEQVADGLVTVGRDGSDLGNLLSGGDLALVLAQELDNSVNGHLDTLAEIHGVASSSNVLDTLGKDGTGENGGGGGAVTSSLVGLVGNILDQPMFIKRWGGF